MFASRGPRARRLLGRGAAILIFFFGGGEMIQSGEREREGEEEEEEGRNGFLLVGGGDWLVGWDCGWGFWEMDWSVLFCICYIASRAYRDLALPKGRALFVRALVAHICGNPSCDLKPSQVSPYRT